MNSANMSDPSDLSAPKITPRNFLDDTANVAEESRADKNEMSPGLFEEVFEHASDGMMILDRAGVITRFNRSAENIFGWSRAEVSGKSFAMLLKVGGAPDLEDLSIAVPSKGITRSIEGHRRNGLIFPLELSLSAFRIEDELAFLGMMRDISEQKEMNARLMQADRLVAVGTLASGVAHEINNPLTYVITNLDLLTRVLTPFMGAALTDRRADTEIDALTFAEIGQALVEMRDGAERISRIVLDLKLFSQPEIGSREVLELAPLIESAIHLTRNAIERRAGIVKDLGSTPPIHVNKGKLGQVLLDLLLNAAAAVAEGAADRNEIRIVTRTDDAGNAILEVRDTGCGISPDILSRIFDPFFTTRPVGGGTGLGLSICKSIVEESGGVIEVRSEVGKGTVVTVTLPPGERKPASEAISPVKKSASGCRGRILIVDDEPSICSALRRLLSREHDVEAVISAQAALELLGSGRFDVILSDLMMPGMTGMELYEAVQQRFPDSLESFIFMTGAANSTEARLFFEGISNPCLEKPVNIPLLRSLIADRLSGNGSMNRDAVTNNTLMSGDE